MNDEYARQWIKYAGDDLDSALNSTNSLNIRCYHAQQTIEALSKMVA